MSEPLLQLCGELPANSAPISVSRVCTSGRLNTFTISALSLSTIARGVLRRHDHAVPLPYVEARGQGHAGFGHRRTCGQRGHALLAGHGERPQALAWMRGIAEGIEVKAKVTSPPASATSIGPAPLNGTWIMFVPVSRFSTSPAR